MSKGSKIFVPTRGVGYVSNHIPLIVRYIKNLQNHLIVTSVGKSFHTYSANNFQLYQVSGLHSDDITCLAGDALHTYSSAENVIFAWQMGTVLKHTYHGHKKPVHLLLPFGKHLISVDQASNLRVWDIKEESLFLELTFNNETFKITSIIHPSTYVNKILLGSEQGALQLWNINKSKLIYTYDGWDSAVTSLEQAPALDVAAIGLANGRIILHNLKFDKIIMEFTQDWGLVTNISFRTDGQPIMATGSVSGNIVFWDLEERRVATQLLDAHDGSVTGMVCLPNEPLILTSSPDNTLKMWIFDMTDGGGRLLKARSGHSAPPNYIRFHGANGNNILSAGADSSLRIFSTISERFNASLGKASYNKKLSKKKKGRNEDLIMPPIIQFTTETTREKEWDNVAAIHSGIPVVTTWSYDKRKMGDLKLLPEKYSKKKTDYVNAECIFITHCGNFVIVGYNTGFVERFNIQSGQSRATYGKITAHDSPIRGVCVDNLNQITITGGSDGYIKFWSFKPKKGETEELSNLYLEEPIHFFKTHSESSMLAVALEDFSIAIIDMDNRNVVRRFSGHISQITDATFSPNSRWLITSSMDCSIRTWDIPSAYLIDQFRTEVPCISLTMSPTGETIATAHVDYLGIFLWSNRTLYQHVSLKALDIEEEPELVQLPECKYEANETLDKVEIELPQFISPEQISKDLITMSGLATSRWQNLLNIDLIKLKNKPTATLKISKAAPFFLPTLPSLNFQFDLRNGEDCGSKILTQTTISNLSELGKLINDTAKTKCYDAVIEKLMSLGPSMIDFEIKSFSPEGGGSIEIMLQFLKSVEYMLKSNKNFEAAESYLGLFLKTHGTVIAAEEELRNYLPNIQSCHSACWSKIQEKLMYTLCVVQSLKTRI